MNLNYTHWLLPMIAANGVLFLLGVYAYRKREKPLARTFLWLMVAMSLWTFAYTLELASADLAGKIFWLKVKYLGSAAAPIIWLIFSLQFTSNEKILNRPVRASLWAFYLATLLIVFNGDLQKWMWTEIWIEPGLIEDQVIHGWYFWVYVVVSYLSILISAFLYLRFLRIVPPMHQKQAILMAAGGIIPLLGRIALDIFGLDLIPQLDEVVLFFLISALIFSIALFRYNTLAIMPIAYAQVFQSMHIGVIVLDPKLRVIELNPAAKEIIGEQAANIQGKALYNHWHESNQLELNQEGVSSLTVGTDEHIRYYRSRTSHIQGTAGHPAGYLLLLTGITKQTKDTLLLEKLAHQDGLTGLLNRRTFIERAEIEHERSKRYGHRYAIILFDLDNFKRVNDTYGHPCGDFVLQEVARRMKDNLRKADLSGRYGGEEFIILLPETDQDAALFTAEKIRKALSEPPVQYCEGNQALHITLSAGVALYHPEDEKEAFVKTLLSRADQMLYQSKESGKNRVSLWQE